MLLIVNIRTYLQQTVPNDSIVNTLSAPTISVVLLVSLILYMSCITFCFFYFPPFSQRLSSYCHLYSWNSSLSSYCWSCYYYCCY